MFYQCYNIHDGAQVIQRILKMKERPTAIFAANDQVAAGLLTEAKNKDYVYQRI